MEPRSLLIRMQELWYNKDDPHGVGDFLDKLITDIQVDFLLSRPIRTQIGPSAPTLLASMIHASCFVVIFVPNFFKQHLSSIIQNRGWHARNDQGIS